MKERDLQNIIGGGLLFLFGISFAVYAAQHYPLGTLRRMGAGMFPMGLGVLLAGLSLFVLVPALFRSGVRVEIPLRTPALVLAGIAAFAATIVPFGMIPAVCLLSLIASQADPGLRLRHQIALCIALSAMAWFVFSFGLSLKVPLFRWPF